MRLHSEILGLALQPMNLERLNLIHKREFQGSDGKRYLQNRFKVLQSCMTLHNKELIENMNEMINC